MQRLAQRVQASHEIPSDSAVTDDIVKRIHPLNMALVPFITRSRARRISCVLSACPALPRTNVHGKFQYPLPLKKISKSTKRASSRRDALEPVDETMPPADEDVDEEALLYGDVGACDGTRTNERTRMNRVRINGNE